MEGSTNSTRQLSPFKRILIGLDVSDQTDLVVQASAYLVRTFDAEPLVVTVVNVPTNAAGNEMDGNPANKDEIQLQDELSAHLQKYFGERARNMEVKVLHGDPSERISEYADYSNSDLILVGSKNEGALRKAVLGSVSGSLANKSKKSVLIVK
jgi:nucleotide-binding universal stress UspA family protein